MTTRGARVLVVEDEPLSRDVLQRMLNTHGFDATGVEDGPACLQHLEQQQPDLILLDVSMPGMNGLDVLHWIRQRTGADQLPVILVSALVDSEDVVAGLEAGANDYVVKPINFPVLLARIGVCLRMKTSVERLIDAERHRVMLTALDDACDSLAAPMGEVISHLELLQRETPSDQVASQQRLTQATDWARRVGELIKRFKKVAEYRQRPYTNGLGGFVAASMGEAARHGGAPKDEAVPANANDSAGRGQ